MKMKVTICVIAALTLVGCGNTMEMLEGADYVCITGNVDGPYTDSGATGKGVKVPDGVELTPDLLESLCP